VCDSSIGKRYKKPKRELLVYQQSSWYQRSENGTDMQTHSRTAQQTVEEEWREAGADGGGRQGRKKVRSEKNEREKPNRGPKPFKSYLRREPTVT
jgi:hypothetical protein